MVGRPKKQVNELSMFRFGMILDELKTEEGISQTEFGKRIHTTQQTVSKLRTGEIEVSSTHAQAVTRAFPQYRAEWLLGLDGYKSPEEYRRHLEASVLNEGGQAVNFGLEVLEELYGCELMSVRLGTSGHLVSADNDITGFTFDQSARRLLWFELLTRMSGWQFEWLGENLAAPMSDDGEARVNQPYLVMSKGDERMNLSRDDMSKLIDKMCGFFDVELACR